MESQFSPIRPQVLTTAQFAQKIGIQPATITRSLCVKGHYMGLKPMGKLPNGRLVWAGDADQKILEQAEAY